jgi:hypothetical protein
LSQSLGHVTHVLLTRSRLCHGPKPASSLHLHVLSTPPAFVLSQDQTLRERLACQSATEATSRHKSVQRAVSSVLMAGVVHRAGLGLTGCFLALPLSKRTAVRTSGRDPWPPVGPTGSHMLLSFQRPSAPLERGLRSSDAPAAFGQADPGRTDEYSSRSDAPQWNAPKEPLPSDRAGECSAQADGLSPSRREHHPFSAAPTNRLNRRLPS